MNKVLSTALITIGSLGVLAGIAGAVYGLAKHSDDLKQRIRGDDTSIRVSSSSVSSSQSESNPTSSSSEEPENPDPEAYRGAYPAANPSWMADQEAENNPNGQLGVSVTMQAHKYWEVSSARVQIPFAVKTSGYSRSNGARVFYNLISKNGVDMKHVLVKRPTNNDDTVKGPNGSLNYGNYILEVGPAGCDMSYDFELRITISLNGETKTASQKFAVHGMQTTAPYQGSLPESGLYLRRQYGEDNGVMIQPDSETPNVQTFYPVCPAEESMRYIYVAISSENHSYGLPTMTAEGHTSIYSNTWLVRCGTPITFEFPQIPDSVSARYRVNLRYASAGAFSQSSNSVTYEGNTDIVLRACGPSIDSPLIGMSASQVDYSVSHWCSTVFKNYLPASWPQGDSTTSLTLSWPEEYNPYLHVAMSSPSNGKVIADGTTNSIRLNGIISDMDYTIDLGRLESGLVVPMTIKLDGPKSTSWTFRYRGSTYGTAFEGDVPFKRVCTEVGKAQTNQFTWDNTGSYASNNKIFKLENVVKSRPDLPDPIIQFDDTIINEQENMEFTVSRYDESIHDVIVTYPAMEEGDYLFFEFNCYYNGSTNGSKYTYRWMASPERAEYVFNMHGFEGKTFEIETGEALTIPFFLGVIKGDYYSPYLKATLEDVSGVSMTLNPNGRWTTNGTNNWRYENSSYDFSWESVGLRIPAFSEAGTYNLSLELSYGSTPIYGNVTLTRSCTIVVSEPAPAEAE